MGNGETEPYVKYAIICIKEICRHISVYTENIFGRVLRVFAQECLQAEIGELAFYYVSFCSF